MTAPGTGMGNALRLAFGTLSVIPVRPPDVDRQAAGRAMVLAPVVGLVLGVLATGLVAVAGSLDLSVLLTAALVVGLLALLTRGMHLDGLADTADGLGSGKPPEGALGVMRRGDIGPFGVVSLVLVLLVQVFAVATMLVQQTGALALGTALVVSRLLLPLACSRGVPSARPEGLGAVVVGSVTRKMAGVAVLVAVAAVLLLTGVAAADGEPDLGDVGQVALVAPLGLLVGALVVWWAVRRLGGVTGDVLGAGVEATFTASLVALSVL